MAGFKHERPRAGGAWFKAHALGNDYLVFEEEEAWALTPASVRAVCDRQRGVGADGVVLLQRDRSDGVRHLRMFNPDGSEFERSGNGLRILATYGAHSGWPLSEPIVVSVGGERVTMTVHASEPPLHDVSVQMGRAETGPDPVGLDPAMLDGRGRLAGPDGAPIRVTPVWVGNPHLVVFDVALAEERLPVLGPHLAAHRALAAGANVQLASVEGPDHLRVLIWERGVGRTSASGTSSCAAAVAAVHRGLIEPGPITVHQEGGALDVTVDADLNVVLRGPVEEVAEGRLTEAFLKTLR